MKNTREKRPQGSPCDAAFVQLDLAKGDSILRDLQQVDSHVAIGEPIFFLDVRRDVVEHPERPSMQPTELDAPVIFEDLVEVIFERCGLKVDSL